MLDLFPEDETKRQGQILFEISELLELRYHSTDHVQAPEQLQCQVKTGSENQLSKYPWWCINSLQITGNLGFSFCVMQFIHEKFY